MSNLKLDRDRCALLVIDIQEKLAAAMEPEVMEKVLRNTNILLEAARRLGIPVVLSEQYPKGLGPTVSALTTSLDAIDELTRLEKVDFSVCSAEGFGEVAARLADKKRTQWIVAGMETHICVYQSARALCDSGASVHLAVDAVISRAKHNYRIGLSLAEKAGAHLTSTETIVMDLLARAGGDDFKAISKLIR
jgi:nicotinamidase-related amidase